MSSKEANFQKLLYDILGDIHSNMNTSRDDIFSRCVENKLNIVKHNYSKQLDNLYKYILSRSNIKTIKAINKAKKGSKK